MSPAASNAANFDLPIGLSPRPRDGIVVSSLLCMNDPQPEGHMASYIERRKFLATLGGAAAPAMLWPRAGTAQRGERMGRIAFLPSLAENDPEVRGRIAAFGQAFEALGWT